MVATNSYYQSSNQQQVSGYGGQGGGGAYGSGQSGHQGKLN